MQQHSQIVELKDRLVQALDEQYNVKNVHEVNRVISILEKTNVTREDLERTRLGKHINELRRKTTDKDLAKRAKKLIKTWRDYTTATPGPNVVNVHSNSTTPNATLTSPFNSNSVISPQSFSSDSNFAFSNSYAPSSVSNGVNANGLGRTNSALLDTKTSAVNNNGNSHPALLRIRNQHTSLTSPQEKSKLSVSPSLSSSLPPSSGKPNASFRPAISKTASPRESNIKDPASQVNGHLKSSQHRNHSNLTSPVNATNSRSSQNGLSPGVRNSFKNILGKDDVSPNAFRQKTTPPKSKNAQMASSIINPDSAPSSRHCSPLAFTFNDSRDSTSYQNYKNNYSNQDEFSALDTNDEDSNSSVFSSLSTDGIALSNSRSLLDSTSVGKRNVSRKRKIDNDNDSLRDNFNSIMNSGGRRLQSTQELVQKFNIKLNSNILNKSDVHSKHFSSLSASSSPHMIVSKDRPDSPAKRAKLSRNGMYKNGFHHHDENSLGDFESAILKNNKSLPASPALLSLRNTSHSATTSPAVLSHQSYEDDDEYSEVYSKASSVSKLDKSSAFPSPDNSISADYVKAKYRTGRTITEADRNIMQIYAQLPEINPDDINLMKQIKFDCDDEQVGEADTDVQSEMNCLKEEIKKEEVMKVDEKAEDEEEYDLFEYNEEYEIEEDEEVEVTDEEQLDHDEDVELKSELDLNSSESINRDDNTSVHKPQTEALDSDDSNKVTHREHIMGDILNCDKLTAVDIGPEPQDGDLKSKSTAITDPGCGTTSDSIHDQVNGDSQPDSTNSCDDSNDAISSTIVMGQHEADTTTTINGDHKNQREDSEPFTSSIENSAQSAVAISPLQDKLESIYPEEDYLNDIELLSYYPPSSPFFDQFPPVTDYPFLQNPSSDDKLATESISTQSPPTPPMDVSEPTLPMKTSVIEEEPVIPPTPPPSNPQEHSVEPEPPIKIEPVSPKVTRKRTKRVVRTVLKKKYRKCVAKSKVKRFLVDRVSEQHWENVNGTYDKDGVWRDFGEMTSTYVLQGGENASNTVEDNILHILPYVNFSW